MATPCFPAHSSSLPRMYSGPLSTRMVPGLPHHSMIRSRLRITRSAGREKSTSMPNPSRLNQRFAVEIVQHVQQPECPAIPQPAGHEVRRRGRVGRLRHRQRARFVPLQPLAGSGPQVHLQRAIDSVDPFMVPRAPLDVAQVQKNTGRTPRVLQASVSPTSRSAIASFSARNFGPQR